MTRSGGVWPRQWHRVVGRTVAVGGSLVLAACGSASAPVPAAGGLADVPGPTLATSLDAPGGTGWAVVQMGGRASTADSFWELFARPAGGSSWKLVTPAGVATNGGLVIAPAGTGRLVAGIRPSQQLRFSPLATSADAGAQWSDDAMLSPGLANVPDALAASADGRLLALTDAGAVQIGADFGATWTRLATLATLAAFPAARACGLTALTAVAWTTTGSPLVGGECRTPGTAGLFTQVAGRWQLIGPALTGTGPGPATVLGLATTGGRTTALLALTAGTARTVVAAWSGDSGLHWTLSPPLRTARSLSSVSFRADGTAAVVLTPARRGAAGEAAAGEAAAGAAAASAEATIGWQASRWVTLPPLTMTQSGQTGTPKIATLATSADGVPQVMAVSGGTLTVWQLGPDQWTLQQTVHVSIPYGSSG
ncbi:MAG: hypothetical protein J2P27_03270 [Actinobacteria bacterium]|nr:hypothetical protein [Actinomycetota bacterium]